MTKERVEEADRHQGRNQCRQSRCVFASVYLSDQRRPFGSDVILVTCACSGPRTPPLPIKSANSSSPASLSNALSSFAFAFVCRFTGFTMGFRICSKVSSSSSSDSLPPPHPPASGDAFGGAGGRAGVNTLRRRILCF